MKIGLITPDLSFQGGATELCRQMKTSLTFRGHEVTLLDLKETGDVEDFDILHLASSKYQKTLGRYPDVWSCLEPINYLSYGWKGALGLLKEMMFLGNCQEIIVADNMTAGFVKKAYGRTTENIIPYAVDSKYWNGIKRPHKGMNMVQVGEIQPFKNQMQTLEMFAEWCQKNSLREDEKQLIFLGRQHEPYYSEVRARARQLEVSDHVVFRGHVSRDLVLKCYLEEADVLVHPVKWQGGWLTPFEAVCCGVPVTIGPMAPCKEFYDSIPEPKIDWIRENMTWDVYAFNVEMVYKKVEN